MRRSMILATAAVMASGLAAGRLWQQRHAQRRATRQAATAAAATTPKVGVILPDTKSSARWETADAKYLEEAFEAAGVDYDIQNAQGDKTQFQTIADQMITSGVNVLMIVNLDSGLGQGRAAEGSGPGHRDDRLRPADAGRRRGLLRVVRQRQGRRAPG